jgi:hypothetical protein
MSNRPCDVDILWNVFILYWWQTSHMICYWSDYRNFCRGSDCYNPKTITSFLLVCFCVLDTELCPWSAQFGKLRLWKLTLAKIIEQINGGRVNIQVFLSHQTASVRTCPGFVVQEVTYDLPQSRRLIWLRHNLAFREGSVERVFPCVDKPSSTQYSSYLLVCSSPQRKSLFCFLLACCVFPWGSVEMCVCDRVFLSKCREVAQGSFFWQDANLQGVPFKTS